MASVEARLRSANFDRGLARALTAQGGEVREDFGRRVRRVRDAARSNLRRRSARSTGKIERSIRMVTGQARDGTLVGQVGSDLREAEWVERGTGIYGPHKTPIVPRRGRFMVFTPRGSQVQVFARSVRGQPGKHFLRDAAREAGG